MSIDDKQNRITIIGAELKRWREEKQKAIDEGDVEAIEKCSREIAWLLGERRRLINDVGPLFSLPPYYWIR
ncbi:hypothetical protein GCM10011571_32950 [Marinithermofilum abyssi]|uniref:Uncharacterized protein n=1 Tax=Marinithermofilum abyssi TaxID=1571185 RepID=A0A8J2VJ78_9BACL|nr:hypothetical protein [Marinithermofilum abyssi]GGE28263.1 hypothetical protein GCM10011571_32950 [Marinithermofilum abyssi]